MGEAERYVRESVELVYGSGSTVAVETTGRGGQVRVLGPSGRRVAGWYWDETSASQWSQEQAWVALAGIVKDDERAQAQR